MKSLYILGRQSDIGVAELESLIGSDLIKPVNKLAILSAKPADYIPFSRLGGSTRVCKLLTTLPYSDWSKVQGYLLEAAPQFVKFVPEGKLHVGVSVYGFNINPRQINASALKVKKVIRETGKSVRIVPNTANALNAAQVLRNKDTSSNGWEVIVL